MERAKALEDSEELEAAHKSAATQGDSAVPNAEDEVELHYVCFVKSNKDNHLYELDGRRKGPLDRGDIGENGDVLCEKATAVVQSFIDREKASGRLDFSLVALTPSFD
jgi:ubiquitin carboxyl-terminal hydrolase L3